MTILEYVATLSPEEREQFKDLIAECEERERQIHTSGAQSQAALEQFVQQQIEMHEALTAASVAVNELRTYAMGLYLRLMPTNNIH